MIERIESDLHKDAITERAQKYAKDLTVKCNCTILEFYYGSTKTISFRRLVTLGDGVSTEEIRIQKEI